MNKDSIIQQKSYAFAIKIVKACHNLQLDKKEYVLSRQLLKSATSIGANLEESIGGQSTRDFYTKLHIAYKEARETKYWLRLLKDTNYFSQDDASYLLADCEEILKILGAIIRTVKSKNGL